jgi:pimeloyl-ACP methyl ester carboxylesterase
MAARTADSTITLRDGRKLGYAEFGDPNGKPLLFWSGGSRIGRHPDDSIAESLGVRLITVDRPGFGLSDFQPGRILLDWPDDIAQLADSLGLERFVVAGMSQGGPSAAVCAYKIPQRLTRVGLISSLGPFYAPGAMDGMERAYKLFPLLAQKAPFLLKLMNGMMARNAERWSKQIYTRMPDVDKRVADANPAVFANQLEDLRELYRNGADGVTRDIVIATGQWGFRPEDIKAEVYLWHGEADQNVPPSMAHYLASAIPNCHATFYPGEGHTMFVNHWREILGTLTA